MGELKVNYTVCNRCYSAMSNGQANATSYVFGIALCVKCASGFTKFDSILAYQKQTEGFLSKTVKPSMV